MCLLIYLLCSRLFILNNTVCQKESLSSASGGNSVYFTFSSLYFFALLLKQEILKLTKWTEQRNAVLRRILEQVHTMLE